MPESPGQERVYLPELDGLRFFAFLLVFGFHGGLPWISDLLSLVTLPLFAASTLIGPVVSEWVAMIGPRVGNAVNMNGWVGVQLFFVLSGYLITTLLLREEERYGRVDLKAFWMRRILRIWPLYYLTVALTFFVLPAIDGRIHVAGHRSMVRLHLPNFLAYLGNWSMIRRGAVGDDAVSVLWSVCVEEQFYVVAPLIVVLVGRRWRLAVVAGLMAGSVGTRAWLARGSPDQMMIQYNTLTQLDTMLSGVALALIGGGRDARRSWGWAVAALCLFVLGKSELGHIRPINQVWDFVLVWVGSVGLVWVATRGNGRFRRILADPRLVWLGRISYGLYMLHEVAFWATRRVASRPWARDLPLNLIALGLTVGLASASYYGVERPFLRLKRRWTRVPSRPV